jgi:putative ABC transport system permease protein
MDAHWLGHLARDLRYAAHALCRTPGFTTVAVLTIALGIGANTAVFTVVNAVLLRPLAYRDPGRLVTLLHGGTDPVAVANYLDWRDQGHSFESMAAAEYWGPNLTGTNSPEHLYGLRVTANLLPMLGVPPLLGRLFTSAEDRLGAEHEVILGYKLWQRRFDGDPRIVGRAVRLNNESYTVIGVMPREFQFAPFWATRAELWAPLAFGDRAYNRGGNSLRIFARLAAGITLREARSETAMVTSRLEARYPGTNRDVRVTPLADNVVGSIEAPLKLALGAVGFVLLIACVNVAHMLLARTAERQREIAIRTALGATRSRIASQVLAESALLAGLGGSCGLLLAYWGTRTLVALGPRKLPRLNTVGVDAGTVVFLAAATVLTALLFGVAPALRAAAGGLSGAMNEGGRGGSGSLSRNRLRSALVASEFALAFVLVIGAGLTVRSFAALRAIDPGFDPRHVLSMVVSVAGSAEAEPNRRELFYRQLLERVRTIPGVEAAGAINHLPLAGDMWGWSFAIDGRPKPKPGESPIAVYRIAMPGYFETMRLPAVRGRAITAADDSRAPGVAVINQRAAERYWPGQDPIGQRISFTTPPAWLTVVGIVKDARQEDWAVRPFPEVYLAALQNREFLEVPAAHFAYITLTIRAAGNPADLAPAVKQAVWGFDPNLPISEVLTMEHVISEATAQPRFETLLLGLFGAVALTLAAAGIYGVMNYAVSRRTHEIGIRMSLGATRGSVLRMVIRQGMGPALVGAAVGAAGARALGEAMRGILYSVRPGDPATFIAAALMLGFTALFAVSAAARSATRIEPVAALRQQ